MKTSQNMNHAMKTTSRIEARGILASRGRAYQEEEKQGGALVAKAQRDEKEGLHSLFYTCAVGLGDFSRLSYELRVGIAPTTQGSPRASLVIKAGNAS